MIGVEAVTSLVSGGCIISGAAVSRSLLFTGARVHSYSIIHEAVLLGEPIGPLLRRAL